MRPSILFSALTLLFSPSLLWPGGLAVNGGVSVNGDTCDQILWNDASGQPREADIVQLAGNPGGNTGGYITRVTYNSGGTVTCNESGYSVDGTLSGLGQMVNHGGTGNGWVCSNLDGIKTGASTQVLFQGANHAIYQVDMDEYGDNGNHAMGTWHDRWIYFVANGRDDIVESLSYDFSAHPAGYWGYVGINSQTGHDSRSPYCSFNWTGTGASNTFTEPIDGIEYAVADPSGNPYRFQTLGSSPFSAGYTFNTPAANIPYTLQWKNSPDREIGYVSTLDMTQWAAGGGFTSAVNVGSTGAAMPANWGINYQSNGFQSWMGDKMTWQVPYGAAGGATGGSTFPDWTYSKNWTGYPTMGYTVLIHLGTHSSAGVRADVAEQAAIHALPSTAFTAAVGTVATTGPMNLQDKTSSFTFKPQGFNHIYDAWEAACAGNAADVTLALGTATLNHPTFLFDAFNATLCQLTLNGTPQVEGTDMFTSNDTVNHRLYVTFNKALTGSERIVVSPACGSPTPTPTPTRTATLSPTPSASPTAGGPTNTPAATSTPVTGAGKNYCFSVDYSAVPTLLNYRKLTVKVDVGACSGVSATENGSAVPARYDSATGSAYVTVQGLGSLSSVIVSAMGWTSGGTGAVTKPALYNNYHWAWSQTFDDGYESAWLNGGMVLGQHNFEGKAWRAGEAYVGSFVGQNWGPDPCLGTEMMMTSAEFTAARAAGWDMYNHTWDHQTLTCSNFQSEFDTNQAAALTQFPGYFLNHVVYPYENDAPVTSACAGWPRSYLRTGEQNNNGFNYVDTPIPTGFNGTPSGNIWAADRSGDTFQSSVTAWEALLDAAATNARNTWLINIAHRVYPASCIGNDTLYSTNVNNLTSYYNYIDSKYGAAGNNSLWVAPAGEVSDYLQVRDNAVVTGYTCGTPTPTPTVCAGCSPTDTSTASPTASPSPTATPLPLCSGNLIDHLDAAGANAFGGYWYDFTTAPSTISPSPFSLTSPGYGGTGSCANISGSMVSGTYPGLGTAMAASGSSNLSAFGGFSFYAKGDGGTYRFTMHSLVEGTATNDYKYDFIAPAAWTLITIPWSSLTWPGWGTNYPMDTTQISQIGWAPINPGAYNLSVDEVYLLCPVPTLTPSPTLGAGSATPTRSPSPSGTASPSPSATPTPSASTSATPTPSATAPATASPSATPSATASSSATPSATLSASPTFTNVPPGSTVTDTPTISPTWSASPSPSATPSLSATATPTASPTASATVTVTPPATLTATGTATPTATPPATLTATGTATPTATPTSMPTGTSTATPSVSGTFSPGPSATPLPTLSSTPTLSATPLPTLTWTQGPSASSTPTQTATPSPTLAPSQVPSWTASPSVAATLAGGGPVTIDQIRPYPNPNPSHLGVELEGPADRVEVRIYSAAEVRVASAVAGACQAGWAQVPLPAGWARGLPSGVYYVRVLAYRGAAVSPPAKPARLVLLN